MRLLFLGDVVGRPGRNACDGWCEAALAIARAQPLPQDWPGPNVEF